MSKKILKISSILTVISAILIIGFTTIYIVKEIIDYTSIPGNTGDFKELSNTIFTLVYIARLIAICFCALLVIGSGVLSLDYEKDKINYKFPIIFNIISCIIHIVFICIWKQLGLYMYFNSIANTVFIIFIISLILPFIINIIMIFTIEKSKKN